ncbi:MAG: cobalamin biosynthesis protein CbiG [Proteobacteria bacterium]|nr:MAG: cobalamin biosynthesis protein CbiG [Pseudomonadota bacterium]
MIRIVALTNPGKDLAAQLQRQIGDSEIWFKPKPFAERVQHAFQAGDKLVMICAAGIVVRTLAPVLNNKREDPPVLVLDERGQYVIPLISGHEGGANLWGAEIAKILDAQLVVTTAKSYQPIYTVGMGCERHCELEELQSLLTRCLEQVDLQPDQITSINSLDIKGNEIGLVQLGKALNIPFRTWTIEQLKTVQDQLRTPSDAVFEIVGLYGVAESAALYAAQVQTNDPAQLLLAKQKTTKATCAIARSD